MKAIILSEHGGPEALKMGTVEVSPLKANEVRVKIKSAALNHVDVWVRQGGPAYPVQLPHVPGVDGAGTVEELGAEVEGISKGDRVVIMPGLSCGKCGYCRSARDNQCDTFEILGTKRWGTYAEFVAVPDTNVMLIPDHVTFEEAAAFPVAYLTAWHMVIGRGALRAGETIAVVGASSGVAAAAIQIAHTRGARIFAGTTDGKKASKIKTLGADDVFVSTEGSSFGAWVQERTGGKGADVVIEHVGPATWEESMKAVGKYGRIVTCGATTGPTVPLTLRMLFGREVSIVGARMGTQKEFQELAPLIFSGKIRPIIDKSFPLAQAAQAHAYMEERKQIGKILLLNQ